MGLSLHLIVTLIIIAILLFGFYWVVTDCKKGIHGGGILGTWCRLFMGGPP